MYQASTLFEEFLNDINGCGSVLYNANLNSNVSHIFNKASVSTSHWALDSVFGYRGKYDMVCPDKNLKEESERHR